MTWYYAASFDADWWSAAESRDDAIAQGRAAYPGEAFCIGEGEGHAPGDCLFDDLDQLAEHIDENNEDRAWEETFTAEAGVDLEPLLKAVNEAWRAWVAEHRPTSKLLDFTNQEEIAAAQPTASEAGQ